MDISPTTSIGPSVEVDHISDPPTAPFKKKLGKVCVRIRSHGSNITQNSGEFPRYVYLLVIWFLETPEFPMFSISGKLWNSDLSNFRKLWTPTFFDISHSFMYFTFHLWLHSFPLFHVLFSFMYSGLLSVPGTYLFHSLAYKYLYSVTKKSELRLLLFPSSCLTHPLLPLIYSLLIFRIQKFPRSLALGNPGSLRDSTGNRAIPWVRPGN